MAKFVDKETVGIDPPSLLGIEGSERRQFRARRTDDIPHPRFTLGTLQHDRLSTIHAVYALGAKGQSAAVNTQP